MDERVGCEQVQAALSARADGEDPGLPDAALSAHLATCPDCRAFEDAVRTEPALVPAPVGPAPDSTLPGRISRMAADVDRSGVWWVLRVLLVLVACGYLVVEIPELVLSTDSHHAHLAHHLGIFEGAYAVALVFVAVRPARARALVPFTVVLAVGMVSFAVLDVVRGEAFPLSELSHALELAGMVLVWLLATRRGWPGRRRSGGTPMGGPPPVVGAGSRHLRVAPGPDRSARVGRRAG